MGLTDQGRFAVNLTGAYSRWDLLNVNMRQEAYEPVVPMETLERPFPELKAVKYLEERVSRLEQQIAALSREKAKSTDVNEEP